MTKADIVNEIARKTGVEKVTVLRTVEAFMESVKGSLAKKNNVYLRSFGSFIIKERAKKTARNITKNTSIVIPAHKVATFKPAKSLANAVR
ncbi:MAG: integration host factor subunit beta [Paludibacter sp.]|nr:integration host factor subunit beta [Paludibacter sp.]